MNQNINSYWEKYNSIYSFEEVLREYRDKKVLEFLNIKNPSKILEIGCGYNPLFLKYKKFSSYFIIEPGVKPYENACKHSLDRKNVKCINNFLENCIDELSNETFDYIICSGVLHETHTPDSFLKGIGKLMQKRTSVYINVPNANSIHRLIAMEMGIIDNIFEKSDRNKYLSQKEIFDKSKLENIIIKNIPFAKIDECESFFLKPFTHDQMMNSLSKGCINQNIIEGLYKTSKYFPDNGSELYCIFSKNFIDT